MRDKIKDLLKRKITFHKFRHSLSLHTKIVLFVSAVLILVPALLILILEYKNPQTLGTFTFPEKVMTAFLSPSPCVQLVFQRLLTADFKVQHRC